jgi:hypothetical protein
MVIQLTFSGCGTRPARAGRHQGEFAHQLTHHLLPKPNFCRGVGEDAKNLTIVKNFLYECQDYFYIPVQGGSLGQICSRMLCR